MSLTPAQYREQALCSYFTWLALDHRSRKTQEEKEALFPVLRHLRALAAYEGDEGLLENIDRLLEPYEDIGGPLRVVGRE